MGMKRFILKVVLFGLACFVVDRAFILLKYKETNVFSEAAMVKARKLPAYLAQHHVKAVDIAVYGSSHPQFGISPEIVGSEAGMSCLNLAYGGGTNTGAQYEFIRRLNIQSKIAVFSLDVFSLNYKAKKSDVFQNTFFNDHSLFNSIHEDVLSYSYIYLYSHFMERYKNDIMRGRYTLPYFREKDSVDVSMFSKYNSYEVQPTGWVRGDGYLNKGFLRYDKFTFQPEKESVEALKHIVAYFKEKNTKLVIVQLPEHETALNYRQKYIDFDKWVQQFVRENNVAYINFNNAESFPVGNDSLFFDTDHLNIKGAALFSHMLGQRLKAATK